MLSKFRNLYPQGSIVSELIDIDRGIYLVKVSIQINGITLATGLAGAETVEKAEDSARKRALQVLVLEDGHLSLDLAIAAPQKVTTPITAATETSKTNNHHDSLLAKKSSADEVKADSVLSERSTFEQEIAPIPEPETPLKSIKEVVPEKIVTAAMEPTIPTSTVTTSLLNEPAVNQIAEPEPEAIPAPAIAEYPETISQPPSELANDYYLEQPNSVSLPESEQAIAEPVVTEAPVEFDFNQIRHKIDLEMKRLSWTKEQGRDYLLSTYGKRSRLHLTDDELLEFWHYLETLPN